MNSELIKIARQLANAQIPEEVFGDLGNRECDRQAALRRIYHGLAKVTHPDVYIALDDKELAQTAFAQLTQWFNQAEQKIKSGQYGQKEKILLRTAVREYALEDGFLEDETFCYYPCTYFEERDIHHATFQIVKAPRQNATLQNEVRILDILCKSRDAKKFAPYLPTLLDAFLYEDGVVSRQAAVFEKEEGWYSLEEVRRQYVYGIDPRDMAWIWRRLLVILGFAHRNGVIHGAVLPENVWIQPEQHGLLLKNWIRSVRDPEITGEFIWKIDPSYAFWYPEEILRGEIPTFGTDIGMSAKCMIYLLGGDVKAKEIPSTVPFQMHQFLKGCILPGKRAPQEAWAVKQDFDDLLERLWGERKFHPFKMSTPVG